MRLVQIDEFIISVQQKKDSYTVRLFIKNTRESFIGELPNNYLIRGAESLELSFSEYEKESILAITTENGLERFEYNFKENVFSWCKKTEVWKIFYGKIDMKQSDSVKHALLCFNVVNNYLSHNKKEQANCESDSASYE